MNKIEKNKMMLDYLDSEKGKKDTLEYFERLKKIKKIAELQIDRFHSKYGNNLDFIIDKIVQRYDSSEYRDREYKIGVEPREPLKWFLFEYAQIYGVRIDNFELYAEYINVFTSEAFLLNNWILTCMNGQGSFISVEKICNI